MLVLFFLGVCFFFLLLSLKEGKTFGRLAKGFPSTEILVSSTVRCLAFTFIFMTNRKKLYVDFFFIAWKLFLYCLGMPELVSKYNIYNVDVFFCPNN